MAKKRKGGRRRTRKARTRGQKAVLSLSGLLVLIWMLQRMGILTNAFWTFIQQGNIAGAVSYLEMAIAQNFTSTTGAAATISSGIAVAIVCLLLRLALKKQAIPLKRPRAISV